MSKEVKKIFLVLGLFALSGGLFYNFQELWMMDNNLSIRTISIIFSLCSLITVSTIFLCSNLINPNKIKKFCCALLLIKTTIIFSLFLLNHTGYNVLIKFLIMVDYAINIEIYTCIYPMMAKLIKDDRTYAKKDLVYSSMYNLGVLITGFLLGKHLGGISFDYNLYCLIAGILMFLAFIVLLSVKIKNKVDKTSVDTNVLGNLIQKIKSDKISIIYFLFIINGQISYNCVLSLTITLLTTGLAFSPQNAANIVLFMGVFAVVLGIVILAKLTPKNDYVSLFIKYVMRAFLYLLAIIVNNKWMFLIALMYPKIISESLSHITDAPYINRFDDEYQLAFCNLREMITYFGKAVGTFLCGVALAVGIRLNFVFSAAFAILQALFSIWALKLRKKEQHDR